MSSKNVAIRRDVYDALRRERRAQESFTKLLLRLLNQKGPLQDLHGAWGAGGAGRRGAMWRTLRGLRGGRP
ncbi:MAG TPA: antitoxin VapB family protein [Thermoplasmata archaeon]|nr:antitoxin VapB family protein [Thermoplasmata archaeon]